MNQELSFGAFIRQRRREMDLTQEELARRVGCAAITLRKIEADDLRSSVQIAERLAMALAIPLEERGEFVRKARSVRPELAELPQVTPSPTIEEIGREDLTGRAIRGYALAERIGMGGMGSVYRAVQPNVDREVAVKIILPAFANHPDFIRRFEAEAQLVARLEHPHIVPLYDYWREPGVAYLVMRLLRGGNIQNLLGQGTISIDTTAHMLEQICSALTAAHRIGVIHRDLKPANVLLDDDNNAYLADFGIAKNLGDPDFENQTQVDAMIGSPQYMSPEQIRSLSVRPQTDIYCLGVMLYEMLTGALPFAGPTPFDLIQQHVNTPMPPLSARRAGLPSALDAVITRATAKDPDARYADALSLFQDFRQAIGRIEGERIPAIAYEEEDTNIEIANPFKGLRAFGEADAENFFGRETLVQQLLARLAEGGELSRFLGVIGPSGSGKSSVVRAGLIPALRRGGLPGSENWFVVDMLPGKHPYEELEASLLRVAVNPPESLLSQLKESNRGLLRSVHRILPADDSVQLVLVIDQFEEVFTLVEDEAERALLLESLATAVLDERSRLRVIITLRADFTDKPLRYVDFGELLNRRFEFVLPLTADELERAVAGPAQRVGLKLEKGLVSTIIRDTGNQPSALPLLQYALSELYEKRDGRTLTNKAYKEIGGVLGALGRSAETVHANLDQTGQSNARQLFLRLVTLGEGTEDTRRRVLRSELDNLTTVTDQLAKVIDAFGKARLLSFDRDPITRGATIEVAHEALLREWTRLREWLNESRSDVRLQRQLASAVNEWNNAQQESSYLLTGAKLEQFEGWSANTTIALTQSEHAYLEASISERQKLLEKERLSVVRLRTLNRVITGIGVVALVLAFVAGTFGLSSSRNANAANQNLMAAQIANTQSVANASTAQAESNNLATQQAIAETNFANAESQRLAAEGNGVLQRGESAELAALLAMRGLQASHSPQADAALQRTSRFYFGERIFMLPQNSQTQAVAFSHDGKYMLTGSRDNIARMWNVQTGEMVREFVGHTEDVIQVSFSPDDKYVLTSSYDKAARLWDAKTGKQLRTFTHNDAIGVAIFSPDGKTILTSSFDNTTVLWDAQTGAQLRTWTAPLGKPRFSPDGKQVINIDESNQVQIWDVATGQMQREFATGNSTPIFSTDISPDGRYLVTGWQDKTLQLWDIDSGTLIRTFTGHTEFPFRVVFSPDGKYLLSGSLDTTARLWDVETGKELHRYTAHTASVYDVAFSPDGHHILTAGKDGTVRLWDINVPSELQTFSAQTSFLFGLKYSPDGKYLATGSADGTAMIWDTATGEQLHVFPSFRVDSMAFSPDGRLFLMDGQGETKATLWDLQTGTLVRSFQRANDLAIAAFTPDGRSILIGGSDVKTVQLVDVQSGQVLQTFAGHTANGPAATLSVDGKFVVTGTDSDEEGNLRLWDAATGKQLLAINNSGTVVAIAISPDDRYILSGSRDNIARLYDAQSAKEIRDFVGHTNIIWNVTFSPDGKYVLTASQDKTARLWDVATGEQLRLFPGHGNSSVANAVFSPDGKYVVVGSFDGTAQMTYVDLALLTQDVCSRLLRDFTDSERMVYSIKDTKATCAQP